MASALDPRIKLRHVLCFIEVVRQGTVAKAGHEMGMTQPAVSKALGELDEILGVPLFERSGRNLRLTPFGELFQRYANLGLATLRQGVDAVADARTGVRTLAFGALPTVEAGVVPHALRQLAQSPFAGPVVVQSGPSPYLLDLLRTGTIEFVVGRMAGTEAMAGLSFEHLYSEELVVVVRPQHPLATLEAPTLRDVARYQMMAPPRGAIIRPAVDELLLAAGIGRLVAEVQTVSNTLGRSYTLMHDAAWIISLGVVATDIAEGNFVRLPVDLSTTRGPVGITYRTETGFSDSARMVIEFIRHAVEEAGS